MNIKEKAKEKINRFYNNLIENNDLFLSPLVERNYNYEFVVSKDNINVKVQVYFGKKGVKTILQGNKETELYKMLNELIIGENNFFEDVVQENIPQKYIGSDESGKGDFFGPLVTAAFFVNEEISNELIKLNVRDSKTLSDNQINEIADKIKENFPENFSIFVLLPEKYNQLYDKLGRNLNKLLAYSHSQAIKPLLKKFDVSFVVIDKFSNRQLELEAEEKFKNVTFYKETKAEKYPGVAAASILARAEVNRWFDEINFKLKKRDGITLPKGASNEVDKIGKIIIEKYGTERLHRIMKLHFKNFSKIR